MRMRLRRLLMPIMVMALVLAACGTDDDTDGDDAGPGATEPEEGDAGDDDAADEEVTEEEVAAIVGEYPREETVFTSGAQWGPPSSWNPVPGSGEATGVRGLLYEALFLFDPFGVELEPWLAESGEWTADDVYEVTLRDGITWSDGEPMTADDVVFTYELAREESVAYHSVWNWLDSVEAVDELTARFSFSDPRYQEWDNNLYARFIVPEHIFSEFSGEELMSTANENPIGSGPYLYSTHGSDRMVWERNDDWWGTEALGLEMQPRYVVDIVNSSNEVALGLLLQGGLDLSNNFLPGVATLVEGGYGIQTFFPDAPYMLSANTAMLIPNSQQPPMDDPAFRRALAQSVNTQQIVEGVYDNIVAAAHPTGLLPVWEDFYDESVVEQHGFGYDPDAARQILADAGYEDTTGDGFVETPDGDPIELSLIVPAGWTDWMDASRVIANGAQAVGINVEAEFPDSGAVDDARTTGDFDLVINNWAGLSNTPWTYYNHVFNMPIQDQMWSGNFGRFEAESQYALTEELAGTAMDDPRFQELLSQLQQEHLEQLHMIPLWYNGLWAQANTSVWTNWPADGDAGPDLFPSTWGGLWNMGGVKVLAEIELAADE